MLLLLGSLVPLCSAQSTLLPAPGDVPVYTVYTDDVEDTGACGETGTDTAVPVPPPATGDTADTADTAPPTDSGDGTVAGPGYLVDCGCSMTGPGAGRLSLVGACLFAGVVARRRRC